MGVSVFDGVGLEVISKWKVYEVFEKAKNTWKNLFDHSLRTTRYPTNVG